MSPRLIICIAVILTALIVNPEGLANLVNGFFSSLGIFTSTLGK